MDHPSLRHGRKNKKKNEKKLSNGDDQGPKNKTEASNTSGGSPEPLGGTLEIGSFVMECHPLRSCEVASSIMMGLFFENNYRRVYYVCFVFQGAKSNKDMKKVQGTSTPNGEIPFHYSKWVGIPRLILSLSSPICLVEALFKDWVFSAASICRDLDLLFGI